MVQVESWMLNPTSPTCRWNSKHKVPLRKLKKHEDGCPCNPKNRDRNKHKLGEQPGTPPPDSTGPAPEANDPMEVGSDVDREGAADAGESRETVIGLKGAEIALLRELCSRAADADVKGGQEGGGWKGRQEEAWEGQERRRGRGGCLVHGNCRCWVCGRLEMQKTNLQLDF